MKLHISHFSHIMTQYLCSMLSEHELCNPYDADVIIVDDKTKIIAKTKHLVCTTENDADAIKALMASGADEVLILPATKEILDEKLKLLAS